MAAVLYLVAGPNGAGKSTFTSGGRLKVPVLDPDVFARAEAGTIQQALLRSGRKLHDAVASNIATRRSFALETTLSGKTPLRIMTSCRAAGMTVVLYFIGVEKLALSVSRVYQRVSSGGHDVPEVDQTRRFPRAFSNLGAALALSDFAYIYDNSEREGHRLMASKVPHRSLEVHDRSVAWLRDCLKFS